MNLKSDSPNCNLYGISENHQAEGCLTESLWSIGLVLLRSLWRRLEIREIRRLIRQTLGLYLGS